MDEWKVWWTHKQTNKQVIVLTRSAVELRFFSWSSAACWPGSWGWYGWWTVPVYRALRPLEQEWTWRWSRAPLDTDEASHHDLQPEGLPIERYSDLLDSHWISVIRSVYFVRRLNDKSLNSPGRSWWIRWPRSVRRRVSEPRNPGVRSCFPTASYRRNIYGTL